jgi:Flp pilus assembly pilin Flp
MAGRLRSAIARHPGAAERGASLVEFALVLPFVAILVLGTVDLGRAWSLQNRLSNAAREAAAAVESDPRNLDPGCAGGNNAHDRAGGEDPGLAQLPGFDVVVERLEGPVATRVSGCQTANAFRRGDTARVTVTADFSLLAPLIGAITGDPIRMRGVVDAVVQVG